MNPEPSDQERFRQGLSTTEPRDLNSSDPKPFNTNTTTSGDFDSVSKSQNTGTITTATNATNEDGFTHPQHNMSAPGRSTSREESAGGITTSTNRTTDSGFTSPGQDMGGSARSTTGLNNTRGSDLDNTRSTSGLDTNNSNSNSRGTYNQNLNTTGDSLASQDLNRADNAHNDHIDSKSKPSEKPSADDEPSADVSGAGPRDLSTIAREHGGDAGSHGSDPGAKPTGSNNDSGLPADQSEEKGTGEQYVKSSGLQADGGDFDATRPGAGREADRLMEQKGIVNTSAGGKDKGSDGSGGEHKTHGGSSSGEAKEKHGFVDKIKEKLHKH